MDGVDLANFLWQHYVQGQWINFSDENIKILNKAIKKNQKTVRLPNKAITTVNFDHMVMERKPSSIKEKIRPVIYNSGFFAWMFLKNQQFYSYKADVIFLLEIAYERKEKVFKYYDNGDFEINLDDFQDINEKSKVIRPITREEVQISSLTSELFNISLDTSALKKMYENYPLNFKTRYIIVPSLPRSLTRMVKSENIEDVNPPSGINICDSVTNKISVDKFCPNRDDYDLFSENEKFYTATLNFVKLQQNSNKYFILQLLKSKTRHTYNLFTRSGRIGTDGEHDVKYFRSNLRSAKSAFEKKFHEKTKNNFTDNTFKYVKGQYNLLRIAHEYDESNAKKLLCVKSGLDPTLEELLRLICCEDAFHILLKEMYYDSSCVPLGDLTLEQLTYAYSVLKEIIHLVSLKSSGTDLISACNEFYSCIPHNFGNNCLPLIQSEEDIEEKKKMLSSLFHIRLALKAMYGEPSTYTPELKNPLDGLYEKFHCFLENLDPTSSEYIAIEKTLKETRGPTHTDSNFRISNIFACHYKHDRYYDGCCNKFLLWHGSIISNWGQILLEGLRIAPPGVPTSGSMFGKGIYFADVSTKAANYCFLKLRRYKVLLAICEVSMGNILELLRSDPNLPASLPSGYDSVMGKGKISPSNFRKTVLSPNAKVPFGPLLEDMSLKSPLMYNEYIVYDETRVQIKYLLQLECNSRNEN